MGVVRMIGTREARSDRRSITAFAVRTLPPPVAIVIVMRRWFVKGLADVEK